MMNFICKWYWYMNCMWDNYYFKRKYSRLTHQIYYDRRRCVYVNPKIINERGCAEYICSESVRDSLFYSYSINGTDTHAHTIAEVFLAAYNQSDLFSISEKNNVQYSQQEFDLICKLVEQGKNDRFLSDNLKLKKSKTPFVMRSNLLKKHDSFKSSFLSKR